MVVVVIIGSKKCRCSLDGGENKYTREWVVIVVRVGFCRVLFLKALMTR